MSKSLLYNSLLIVALCVALYSVQTVATTKKYEHPRDEHCTFVADYSTVETSLRTAILKADVYKAASLLESRELFSLGAGLKYEDSQTCFLDGNGTDRNDPDIVAFRALALNAEKGGDTEKLARAIVLSFELDCQCGLFTAKEQEELVWNFKEILDDEEDRREILEFGEEDEDDDEEEHDFEGTSVTVTYSTTGGRRLLESTSSAAESFRRQLTATESSPTNSFICAHCEPRRQCRKSGLSWCQ